MFISVWDFSYKTEKGSPLVCIVSCKKYPIVLPQTVLVWWRSACSVGQSLNEECLSLCVVEGKVQKMPLMTSVSVFSWAFSLFSYWDFHEDLISCVVHYYLVKYRVRDPNLQSNRWGMLLLQETWNFIVLAYTMIELEAFVFWETSV